MSNSSHYDDPAARKAANSLQAFLQGYQKRLEAAKADFQRQEQKIKQDCEEQTYQEKQEYKQHVTSIRSSMDAMLSEMRNVNQNIQDMSKRLYYYNRRYAKFWDKNCDALKEFAEQHYKFKNDTFVETHEQIIEDFTSLSQRYHALSKPNDFQELAMLSLGAARFELDERFAIPKTTEQLLKEYETKHTQQLQKYQEAMEQQLATNQKKYQAAQQVLSVQFQSDLETQYPGAFLQRLCTWTQQFRKTHSKFNATESLLFSDAVLFRWLCIPLQSVPDILRQPLRQHFTSLLENDCICIPYVDRCDSYRPFYLNREIIPQQDAYDFIYAEMYRMLTLVPVGKLEYNILDEANHGNSIEPFLEAKRMLPELFDQEICTEKEAMLQKLRQLNSYVEHTVQNVLSTQYKTILEYAQATGQELPKLHLLVLFDFPNGLDDAALSALSNILRQGSRCGVFTILYGGEAKERESKRTEAIRSMCSACRVLDAGLRQDGFPLQQLPMPEKSAFDSFLSKYLLLYENIQNRGIASMALIRELLCAERPEALMQLFQRIAGRYESMRRIGTIAADGADFPAELMLGAVQYPRSIFEGAHTEQAIVQRFANRDGQIVLPFSMDLQKHSALYLDCETEDEPQVTSLLRKLIWSFLSAVPVNSANISVVDIKHRGDSLKELISLKTDLPMVFRTEICTSADALKSLLEELNAQINERTQKLRGVLPNILAYNKQSPTRPEACQLLILYDFPEGFDTGKLKLLESILANGPKCGIYTVICRNPKVKLSRYESDANQLDALLSHCNVIKATQSGLYLQPYNLRVIASMMVNDSMQEQFVKAYQQRSDEMNHKGIFFDDILDAQRFQRYSAGELTIPIGIGDGEQVVDLRIGGSGSSHNLLIGGGIGGGKSTLMHTLIMSTMLHYKPDDVIMYLLDFKGGVEFKIYDGYHLPHIHLLAVDAMQEFGLSILEHLASELKRRSELCKNTTPVSTGFSSYRRNKTAEMPDMPRILLIMDEFQILYNEATNRKVANTCAHLTHKIVSEGRAYGFTIIMATQSMNVLKSLSLNSGTIEQMRIRIGLKCGENDAYYLFSDDKGADAFRHMVGPIGTAVMNHDYTVEDNQALRVAYCDKKRHHAWLQFLADTYKDTSYHKQTFEGSAKYPMMAYLQQQHITQTDALPCLLHMGVQIAVAPPFCIRMDKKKNHNLLLCGANPELTSNILGNYMVSALLNRNAEVYCFDGNIMIEENDQEAFYQALQSVSQHFHLAESNYDTVALLVQIYEAYRQRKKKPSKQPIFVIFKNLQYLNLVKQMLQKEKILAGSYLDEDDAAEADSMAAPAVSYVADPVEQMDADGLLSLAEPDDLDLEALGAAAFSKLGMALQKRPEPAAPKPAAPESDFLDPEDLAAMQQTSWGALFQLEKRSTPTASTITAPAAPKHKTRTLDLQTLNISDALIDMILNSMDSGIYFVVSTSDLQTVKETMKNYMVDTLSKFGERMLFSISNNDAEYLIPEARTEKMPNDIVYYYDGVTKQFQFKPYIAPTAEEVRRLFSSGSVM